MPEDFAIGTNPRKGFSLIPESLDLYGDAVKNQSNPNEIVEGYGTEDLTRFHTRRRDS